MSFEALTNRGEYLSAHYLAEVLPTTLKGGLLKRWSEEEKGGRVTPRAGLRSLRRDYFTAKAELADLELFDAERLHKLNAEILARLGFDPKPQTLTVERAGRSHEIAVAHAELGSHGIVAIECGWAVDTDAASDPSDAGRLLNPFTVDSTENIESGAKLASWLFAADEISGLAKATGTAPRYVLILGGGVITLADRSVWGEGRYLAVSLDIAFGRNDDKELDVIAALFGADSLRPPTEGGAEPLADLVAGSRQHAVGVSTELREGLRVSVELIANEVLDRIRQAGYQPQQVMDLDELAKELSREALRYLYRILFLLYAEARPELGVLPVNDPEYLDGYSLARLGDLISRRLAPSSEQGYHLYDSLDLLFRMVNEGHRPRGSRTVGEKDSEDVGLRFEPMRSDLFLPTAINLIGQQIPQPGTDPDDPDSPKLDTRLRNATLYEVLRRLMLTKGGKKRRGGFISYAQLGINQLGAVYEGLMSYTGSVATEQLYEVAKNGDPKDGSWMIPASKVDDYDDAVFVVKENPLTGVRSRVSYDPGQFVYRLAGRDRQTSASYYTPHSLTEVTVQLALKYRLDQDGTVTKARELLDWTICEPALGSGAFLNEAIDQVAAEYLRRRQEELTTTLDPEQYQVELQRVKAYIALHNCYGVDLNRTAVELAEVSLWLNVMHKGLQAPWFGLHLRRGNSLIGGRRQVYAPDQLAEKAWLTTAPSDAPFRDGPIPDGSIHHFLLPAEGWGAVAGEKEARELAPTEAEALRKWRAAIKRSPSAKKPRGGTSQVERLQALSRRVEYLWDLVQQRLTISEKEIRRQIHVWKAEELPVVTTAVPREKILADLEAPGTPYWRLKTLMDTWCALWFWPLDAAGLLDGSAGIYGTGSTKVTHEKIVDLFEEPVVFVRQDLFGHEMPQQLALPRKVGKQKVTVTEQLRQQKPLASLDDWLTFTEALLGRTDLGADTLLSRAETLSDLDEHEAILVLGMGMDEPYRVGERFPWVDVAVKVAEEQGFFHWELTFAHAFSAPQGGFDVQVGNPPWVRPDWKEDAVLAEREPWFRLAEKPPVDVWRRRKTDVLGSDVDRSYFVTERTANAGMVAFVGSPVNYPLLEGTRPDLYRAVMCQVWKHLGIHGTSGLVHPDTHFGGTKEGKLRAAAYRHLRLHAHFTNKMKLFAEISDNVTFGVHVSGVEQPIRFKNLSWIFSPSVAIESLDHEGDGPPPGYRYEGKWDLRPHGSRVIDVDIDTLAVWQTLRGVGDDPVEESPLLYPITTFEDQAIAAVAAYGSRLGAEKPHITTGYNETTAKTDGIIRWQQSEPALLDQVVLQGPHVGIATPIAKQPRVPYRSNNDWDQLSLTTLPEKYVPRTNYALAGNEAMTRVAQDVWHGKRYTDYYRLAWRRMIAFNTERSLFAALIPPGPAHVFTINSMSMTLNQDTALAAGFWSALPLDYVLRVLGKSDLTGSDVLSMPSHGGPHPLRSALLLRTLRLNCLTEAYSDLWIELHEPEWIEERWAAEWAGLRSLDDSRPQWHYDTPLRAERERRAALVEIDALVAVWLGIGIEELVAILRSRYPILTEREDQMWFDANGSKIAADSYAFGVGQTKEDYGRLVAHLEDGGPIPDGYTAPFYKADRENEYRQAHTVFSKRLQDAIDAGWTAS